MTPQRKYKPRARRYGVFECIPPVEDVYTPTELQLQRRANLLATGRTASELHLEAKLIERKITFEPQSIAQGFFVDFRILPHKLAIEVDGWYHNLHRAQANDSWRAGILFHAGWSILRFSNKEVLADAAKVVDAIAQATERLSVNPDRLYARWPPGSMMVGTDGGRAAES